MNQFVRLAFLCGVATVATLLSPQSEAQSSAVTVTTDCGMREFTYDPYPPIIMVPIGTPIIRAPSDGYCLTTGSIATLENFYTVYPAATYINRVEVAFYKTRPVYNQYVGWYWHVFAEPSFVTLSGHYRSGPQLIVPMAYVSGKGPTALALRITFVDGSQSRTITVGMDKLFYIPNYSVYFAAKRVNIGWDAFPRFMTGETLPTFSLSLPRGWEKFCKVSYISIHKSGFPGTPRFRSPCGYQTDPSIGYEVSMPGGTSGSFNVIYQVTCPNDFTPTGANLFDSWSYAGSYSGGLNVLKANHGMPPNRIQRQSSVAGSCPVSS